MAQPNNVHVVGSFPFSCDEEVFVKSIQVLPRWLQTIPDSKTGSRYYFVLWQSFVFPSQVLSPIHRDGKPRILSILVARYDQASRRSSRRNLVRHKLRT